MITINFSVKISDYKNLRIIIIKLEYERKKEEERFNMQSVNSDCDLLSTSYLGNDIKGHLALRLYINQLISPVITC